MIVGTYSGGSASAYEYSTFQELLTQLVDNNSNQIDAINVRNSTYTLWQRIEDVRTFASQSIIGFQSYTNTTPTMVSIGGIPQGSTFNSMSMSDMWNMLLYPYIAPTSTLSVNPIIKELGESNVVNLNWSVTRKSNPISSIVLHGNLITPTGNNQSGTLSTNAQQNINTTFILTVGDGTSSITTTANTNWLNAIYWGTTPTFALPNMDIVTTSPIWANGAGVGSGKRLTTTKSGTYNNINGAGEYLVFAWPSTYGTPSFIINGLVNTAYTKIGSSVIHTNMHGYVNPNGYDIWISNTAQNSPIDSFVIN